MGKKARKEMRVKGRGMKEREKENGRNRLENRFVEFPLNFLVLLQLLFIKIP